MKNVWCFVELRLEGVPLKFGWIREQMIMLQTLKGEQLRRKGLRGLKSFPLFYARRSSIFSIWNEFFSGCWFLKRHWKNMGFFRGCDLLQDIKHRIEFEKQKSWFEKQLINVKKWTTNTSIMYKVYILWYEKSNKIPENLITDGNPNRRGSYDWTAESGAEGQDGSQWRESWERAESSREALESRPQHNYAVPSSKSYMYTYTKQKKINPTLLQRSIQQFRPNSLFIGNI